VVIRVAWWNPRGIKQLLDMKELLKDDVGESKNYGVNSKVWQSALLEQE
jgi:hypothetical protein